MQLEPSRRFIFGKVIEPVNKLGDAERFSKHLFFEVSWNFEKKMIN